MCRSPAYAFMVCGEALPSRKWRRKSPVTRSTVVRGCFIAETYARKCIPHRDREAHRKANSWPRLCPRMMLRVYALQTVERDMGINLRGRNVRVAEDRLDRAQVGSVLHHVRCAGVAQHVRTGMASRHLACLSYQLPD